MTDNSSYLRKRFVRASSFTAEAVVDELLLVHIHDETQSLQHVYTLNTVGARIWELIDGERQVAQIRDVLVDDFEIGPEAAETDLILFLEHLEQVGAISAA